MDDNSQLFCKIEHILGTPYHKTEYGLLYNLDCIEGLKKIQNNPIVSSTITSPPYNIGKEYESVMDNSDYIEWLSSVFSLTNSITYKNGNMLLNIGYFKIDGVGHSVPISYLIWNKIDMYLQQEIVWNYGAGVSAKKFLSPRNEKILWYVKNPDEYTFNLDDIRDPNVKYPNQKKNGRLRCNTIGKNPSDVWEIAKVTSGANRSSTERTSHPAQFPVDLITRLVKGFTNENDIILDPFIGSGTVAEVAINTNRRYLGFEIDENYCKICSKRIDKTINEKKSTLFFV